MSEGVRDIGNGVELHRDVKPHRWFTEEEVVAAISGSGGFVTTIAERLGCRSVQTIYNWLEKSRACAEALEWERASTDDMVESQMLKRCEEGSDQMLIFYARTRMRRRGFAERFDSLNININNLSREQLERIKAGENPVAVIATDSGGS